MSPCGAVELWQDGALLLRGTGQTLPDPDAVCDRVQQGMTTNGTAARQALFVDDIRVSGQEIAH